MKSIADIQEKIKERLKSSENSSVVGNPSITSQSSIVCLPAWPDVARRVPNGMLRSALFGAVKKGRRRYMKAEQIAAQDGIEICFTGEQLDQGDLDVWESVLHLCRDQAMGSHCRFTAYTMLKLLGLTDTGSNRKTLHTRLVRLRSGTIEMRQGRFTYFGGLLVEGYKDEDTHECVVVINAKLLPFFEGEQFTLIDWNVRHALAGQPLAQWLHGYFSSHAQPFPVKVETLHKLCGSESSSMSDFAKVLRKALHAVSVAGNANGQPFSYEIHGSLLSVKRTASLTQKRHLIKRMVRRIPIRQAIPS